MRARSSLETRLLSKEWLENELLSERSAVKLPLRCSICLWEPEAADTVAALERFVALGMTGEVVSQLCEGGLSMLIDRTFRID
jgi:hypothetical protein